MSGKRKPCRGEQILTHPFRRSESNATTFSSPDAMSRALVEVDSNRKERKNVASQATTPSDHCSHPRPHADRNAECPCFLRLLIRSAIRACQHTIDSPGPWPGDAEEAQAPALPCKLPQINPVAFHDLRESGTVVVVTERPGLKEDFQRKCLTCYG